MNISGSIGNFTEHVNGKIAGRLACGNRLLYRMMLKDILARVEERLQSLNLSAHAASQMAGRPDAIRNMRRALASGREGVTTPVLRDLAPVLETSLDWLMTGHGDADAPSDFSMTRVPIISWVSAGTFQEQDGVLDTSEFPVITVPNLPAGEWFALRVEGDSMDRISPPGSIIVVNCKEKRLVPNACYVILDEKGAATYKRYRPAPNRFEPVSVNSAHEPIFPIGPVRIVGRVKMSILEM